MIKNDKSYNMMLLTHHDPRLCLCPSMCVCVSAFMYAHKNMHACADK